MREANHWIKKENEQLSKSIEEHKLQINDLQTGHTDLMSTIEIAIEQKEVIEPNMKQIYEGEFKKTLQTTEKEL